MPPTLSRGLLAALLALATASPSPAAAQNYPNRPIRVVVGFPPGGSADLVARLVSQKMTDLIGQTVFVENKPGADTIIAMESVAKAAPDGYTVGYVIGSSLTMNPTLYSKLPYDPAKDYIPVTLIANVPLALVAHPSVPANNAKEFAEYVRANPNKLFYGHGNIIAKVATESLLRVIGGKMNEVPYKGSTPNLQDLMRGEVQVTIEPIVGILANVQQGKLRALAVTGSERSALLPDVPTVAQAGLTGYAFNNWHGMVVPAGTPKDVVDRLYAEIAKAAKHPDVGPRARPLGVDIVALPPDEFAKRTASEREYWTAQLKELGIRAD